MAGASDPAEDIVIGARDNGTAGFFEGILDKLRLSEVARSTDWIAAQSRSMTDQFVIHGQPERDILGVETD